MTTIETICDLTPSQAGMFLHAQADSRPGLYVEQAQLDLEDDLDPQALEAAWTAVSARHAALRTSMHAVDRTVVQIVHGGVEPVFACETAPASSDGQEAVEQILREDRARGFDLATAPLARLRLIRREPRLSTVALTWHHLIMDGWSLSVLLDDLAQAYTASRTGTALPPGATCSTVDYVRLLKGRSEAEARAFWTDALATVAPLRLPPAWRAPQPAQADIVEAALSLDETVRLEQWRRARRVSLAAVVNGAWALVLRDLTGRDDLLFGTTTSGRDADMAGLERAVGLLMNTVPVRVRVAPDMTHDTLVRAVHEEALARAGHEWVPAPTIGRWLGHGAERLFDSLIVIENYPLGTHTRRWADTTVRAWRYAGAATQYPLMLLVIPGSALRLRLETASGLFEPRQTAAIVDALLATLRALPDESDKMLPSRRLPASVAAPARVSEAPGPVSDDEPATPTEAELMAAVRDVLRVARVRPGDRLVDLGGHSLAALDLSAEIQERFQVTPSLADLLDEHATMRELAARIDTLVIAGADEQALAAIIEELHALSDEDVRAQLGVERRRAHE